jgi:hypothetical protein
MPIFATAFGLVLGAGFFTVINFIGYYLLLASCFLAANPAHAGMLMVVYGMGRAAPVLGAPLASWMRGHVYTSDTAVAVANWFVSLYPRLAWFQAAVLFMVAVSTFAVSASPASNVAIMLQVPLNHLLQMAF